MHYVLTVNDWDNELKTDIKNWLYPILHILAVEQYCKVLALNGMEDHIHILMSMSAKVSVFQTGAL
ncbi:MAG TPA: transposase [Candidatus Cloacimonadota bacterium]|nr:transposase [Candidatus Cloacimonadota bacterium]